MEQKNKIPKHIIKDLREVVKSIMDIANINCILLYGSYSKGTFNKDSDLDIAIFVRETEKSLYDIFKKVLRICSCFGIDIQPQVFYDCELVDPIGIVEEIVEYGIDITDLKLWRDDGTDLR